MSESKLIRGYLSEKKPQISKFIEDWIPTEQQKYLGTMDSMHTAFERILSFSRTGKMIRGALVLLLSEAYGSPMNALPIASSMELFQAFLLIHDDIMDRDPIRRGKPAIYMQYATDVRTNNLSIDEHEATRFGEALGICVGDIASFLGYQLITHSTLNAEIKAKLFERVNYELTRVGLAQMQDVMWSTSSVPSRDEIYQMYINKTGRYTFTLPFLLGALIGDAGSEDLVTLENLGDDLGILFQIKDDELGIIGDPEITGKPKGSDLYEGKKTIFVAHLIEKLSTEEKIEALSFLGQTIKSDSNILSLTTLMEKRGVFQELSEEMSRLEQKCYSSIDKLHFRNESAKNVLRSLVYFCKERDK